MTKKILMATYNPHKVERFKRYLKTLQLSVLSFSDFPGKVEVKENGNTPEENALKKAKAGFQAFKLPTFGVDYWFYIEGLPKNLQPGAYVRRIFVKGDKKIEATDDEMLEYYKNLVLSLGGKAKGMWVSAISLVVSSGKTYTEKFTHKTLLTSKSSNSKTKGEPLNSIQIDPKTGKYFADFTKDEWFKLESERGKRNITFIKSHLHEI